MYIKKITTKIFFINKYEAYSDDLILHFEEVSFLLPIKKFHWITRKKKQWSTFDG